MIERSSMSPPVLVLARSTGTSHYIVQTIYDYTSIDKLYYYIYYYTAAAATTTTTSYYY